MSNDTSLKYAYRLLSYRARSEKELKERLVKKGVSPEDTNKTIRHLKGLGYVDDKALAQSLKRTAMDIKLLGRTGALQYLRQRGISRQEAEGAVSDYEELEGALRLIHKKLKGMRTYPEALINKRLSAALLRRGFSSQTIKKALKLNEEEMTV